MKKRPVHFLVFVLLCLLCSGCARKNSSTAAPISEVSDGQGLEVWFLDVGQGDAAIVQCDGNAMLIDGGEREYSDFLYSFLRDHGISRLTYLVATHPDSDHIGGLPGALRYAEADRAFCTVAEDSSYRFGEFKDCLDKQEIPLTVPEAGDVYPLGEASVTVLYPMRSMDYRENTSVVLRVEYGTTSFLFMGDCPSEDEFVIAETADAGKYSIQSDVIKIAHHGSSSSSSDAFLSAVAPRYAILSVGSGNRYGHPSERVVSSLAGIGAEVLRTDLLGTIHCVSDGKRITFDSQTGSESVQITDRPAISEPPVCSTAQDYVLNTKTGKFHFPECPSAADMKAENKQFFFGLRDELTAMGYEPCGRCNP